MTQSTPRPPMTFEPSRRRVRASFQHHIIADTGDAVILREAGRPAIYYFPLDDVDTAYMARTDQTSSSPDMGEATYWSILMDGELAENGAWTYDDPLPDASGVKGRIAFDPERVEVYELDEEDLRRRG